MFNGSNSNGRPVKVALYARVSTEDHTERETIQSQIQVAKTLAAMAAAGRATPVARVGKLMNQLPRF